MALVWVSMRMRPVASMFKNCFASGPKFLKLIPALEEGCVFFHFHLELRQMILPLNEHRFHACCGWMFPFRIRPFCPKLNNNAPVWNNVPLNSFTCMGIDHEVCYVVTFPVSDWCRKQRCHIGDCGLWPCSCEHIVCENIYRIGELVCANWGAVNSVEELNGKNQTYTHFSIFALSQFFENLAAHHIDVVILFWLQ